MEMKLLHEYTSWTNMESNRLRDKKDQQRLQFYERLQTSNGEELRTLVIDLRRLKTGLRKIPRLLVYS